MLVLYCATRHLSLEVNLSHASEALGKGAANCDECQIELAGSCN